MKPLRRPSSPYASHYGDVVRVRGARLLLRVAVLIFAFSNMPVLLGAQTITPISSRAGAFPESAALVDFNNDGRLDVVVGNFRAGTITLLAGDGTGRFNPVGSIPTGGTPTAIVTADFDNDTVPDLVVAVVAPNGGGSLNVYRGVGGTFGLSDVISVGRVSALVAADIDSDGNTDLALSENVDDETLLFYGTGSLTFEPRVRVDGGSNPYAVAVADLNKDRILDLVVSNYRIGSGSVTVLLGAKGRRFGEPVVYQAGPDPAAIAVADFDKDHDVDIAITNPTSGQLAILRGAGDGSFKRAGFSKSVGRGAFGIAALDFDADGVLDVALTNSASGNVALMTGRSGATFSSAQSLLELAGAWRLLVADVNEDKNPDLLVFTNTPDEATLLVLLAPGRSGRGGKNK